MSAAELTELGLKAQAAGGHAQAEKFYLAALAVAPEDPDTLHLLGCLLKSCGRAHEAVPFLQRCVRLGPQHSEAHYHLGAALHAADRFDEAAEHYEQAIRLRPDFTAALASLGHLHKRRGFALEARDAYEAAVRADPALHEVWHNLGTVQLDMGEPRAAIASFDRALAIAPGSKETRFSRALALLESGELRLGWDEHEVRFQMPRIARGLRSFPHESWDGDASIDAPLLVWSEQGIGDELLFASIYPEVIARVRTVVLECSLKLVALFGRSFPEAKVIARTDPPAQACLAEPAFQIAAGSLGRFFRSETESFPNRRSYLCADPNAVSRWQQRLGELGPGLKVGFCWRSSNLQGERALSCTVLRQWGELFAIAGVHWVCLQYDDCEAELADARRRFGVRLHRYGEVDYFDDLDEVSALMKALDLVISAPTTVSVHAAALGIETWQMTYGAYWQTHGTPSNPWLPALIRFPRRCGQLWEPVLSDMAAQLGAKVGWIAAIDPARAGEPGQDLDSRARSAYSRAQHLKQRDDLSGAVEALREAIAARPSMLPAQIELAQLLDRLDRGEEAEAAYREAIDQGGDVPELYVNLANLMLRGHRLDEALAQTIKATALQPDRADTLAAIGSLWERLGQPAQAQASYRRAIEIDPRHRKAQADLAALLLAQTAFAEADLVLSRAIAADPDAWELQLYHGQALSGLGRTHEAYASFDRAIALAPQRSEGFEAKAEAARKAGDHAHAASNYERALALKPDDANLHFRLGVARFLNEDLEGALQHHRRALACSPGHHDALLALNRTLHELGRAEEAARGYEAMIANNPQDAWAHWNLAHVLLAGGQLARGYEEYEWRFHPEVGVATRRNLPHPHWTGEPLAGKRIVVCREQGIGDQLLFAALFQALIERGADCVLESTPKLVGLLSRSFPGARVVPKTDPPHAEVRTPTDFQVAAGSLARIVRPTPQSMVRRERILSADPGRVRYWRQRLDTLGPELKIGFSWRSHDLSGERFLACSGLDDWLELFTVPGVRFVCLQYDDCDDELARFHCESVAHFREIDMFDDLDETAALMSNLDLVISAPTTVSVLSAALGVPTWQLSHGADWQMLGQRTHPWFAALTRIKRAWGQPRSELMHDVAELLRDWVAARAH